MFLDDPETLLWVVTYTERVFGVFAALLLALYSKYRLWYVPTDVIEFAHKLGFAMEVPLGSHAEVLEVLELLNGIEAKSFASLAEQWRDHQWRTID